MTRPDHRWIQRRLKELPGKNQTGLARVMGVARPRITEIIKGERQVRLHEAPIIAEYLDIPLGDVHRRLGVMLDVADTSIRSQQINVKASVAAGEWREACEFPAEEWEPIQVTIRPEFQGFDVFAARVDGDSMNRIFPRNTILLCVKYIDLGRDPENGEYVIVQRRNEHGMYEITCKKYTVEPDGTVWLIPESTSPKYIEPLEIKPNGEDDSVVIIGKVISSLHDR